MDTKHTNAAVIRPPSLSLPPPSPRHSATRLSSFVPIGTGTGANTPNTPTRTRNTPPSGGATPTTGFSPGHSYLSSLSLTPSSFRTSISPGTLAVTTPRSSPPPPTQTFAAAARTSTLSAHSIARSITHPRPSPARSIARAASLNVPTTATSSVRSVKRKRVDDVVPTTLPSPQRKVREAKSEAKLVKSQPTTPSALAPKKVSLLCTIVEQPFMWQSLAALQQKDPMFSTARVPDWTVLSTLLKTLGPDVPKFDPGRHGQLDHLDRAISLFRYMRLDTWIEDRQQWENLVRAIRNVMHIRQKELGDPLLQYTLLPSFVPFPMSQQSQRLVHDMLLDHIKKWCERIGDDRELLASVVKHDRQFSSHSIRVPVRTLPSPRTPQTPSTSASTSTTVPPSPSNAACAFR